MMGCETGRVRHSLVLSIFSRHDAGSVDRVLQETSGTEHRDWAWYVVARSILVYAFCGPESEDHEYTIRGEGENVPWFFIQDPGSIWRRPFVIFLRTGPPPSLTSRRSSALDFVGRSTTPIIGEGALLACL
jgi:hypothetical protein